MLVALSLSAATLLVTCASAQATWTHVAPTKDYHCSGTFRAPHTQPVSMQACVIVHDSPSGAYVQGSVKVANQHGNTQRRVRPTGYTQVWLDNKPYRNDNCGPITLTGGQSMWCYGKTTHIPGHNRDVMATGYVWYEGGTHDRLHSPHWNTGGTAGFPKDVTSSPDTVHYDDAASWSGGKNCTGGFTRGAQRLQDWLRANWGPAKIGGYDCRPNTNNPSKTSIHGVGRASDWHRNAGNATHRGQVASFIRRMSANGAAMARATGVQYWIWNRQQYSVRGTTVLRRSYSGPNPHTDHVHIEQNLAGSRLQTSYWRLAGG
jgi:hypothetical protein